MWPYVVEGNIFIFQAFFSLYLLINPHHISPFSVALTECQKQGFSSPEKCN